MAMVEAKSLSKNYGMTVALSNASFDAREHEVLGFLGPNGAGKTTAMKILTTYILPTAGTASVGGHDVQDDPIAVRRLIGYLPEVAPLYTEMTTQEYLRFVGTARGMAGGRLRERTSWVVDAINVAKVGEETRRARDPSRRSQVGLSGGSSGRLVGTEIDWCIGTPRPPRRESAVACHRVPESPPSLAALRRFPYLIQRNCRIK